MKEELESHLIKKYPKIFAQADLSPGETCMCWGICVGDGWYNLLDQLCSGIQSYIDWKEVQHHKDVEFNRVLSLALCGDRTELENQTPRSWNRDEYIEELIQGGFREVTPIVPQVVAVQVKEKFGTLRFYYDGGDDYVRGMVTLADNLSEVTCEVCGAPGKIRDKGWVSVRCDEHVKK
jgi:hypothetical protein